jgi:hypothetical protein
VKEKLDSSKASFKLDLIETANADPVLNAYDLKLLAAFVSVMEWPSCRAWLSEPLGRAKTNLSQREFWRSRRRLLGANEAARAYLKAVRSTGRVTKFKLVNPWRDDAREHVTAMTSLHQEVDRNRKATSRTKQAAAQSSNLSLSIGQGQNRARPCPMDHSVPVHWGSKYPSDSSPRKRAVREDQTDDKPERGVA